MRQILTSCAAGVLAAALAGCDLVGFKPLVPFEDTGPAAVDSQPQVGDSGLDSGDDSGLDSGGPVDADEDGYASIASGGDDCDDRDDEINPGADEICDEIDNDCDELIDDGDDDLDRVTATVWFADSDEDGYGDPGVSTPRCEAPDGYVDDASDCDDTNEDINPEAVEVCDGEDVDEDCDEASDDDDPEGANGQSTWYADADGDTYGDPESSSLACEQPEGAVADSTDCDDDPKTGAAVNPGAVEVCDGEDVDEDCDTYADDLDPEGADGQSTWYADADGDTYGDPESSSLACEQPEGAVADSTDCDDDPTSGPDVNPGATEICDDFDVDEDCDTLADDDDPEGASGTTTFYADDDSDGYGDATDPIDACEAPAGYVADDQDCDDSAIGGAAINPLASELAGDEVDQDCDGTEICFIDEDDDGYRPDAGSTVISLDTDCQDTSEAAEGEPVGDCDDGDALLSPDGVEICDGADRDEDCDGQADDDDPEGASGTTTWYPDTDGDGFGDALDAGAGFCDDPGGGWELNNADCDDGAFAIQPTAVEVCDAFDVDEDCDDLADDDDPEGAGGQSAWYADVDGDGYGDQEDTGQILCDAPPGSYVDNFDDCDDGLPAVNPDGVEDCDGLDNDCDGLIDFAWIEDDFQAGIDPLVFTANGDATTSTSFGDTSLQLTSGSTSGQVSTVFFNELFPADESLYISFTMEVSSGTGSPQAADGMALVLAETDNVCLLGIGGGSLGIAGQSDGYVFEFDLYDNGAGVNGDRGTATGLEYPHCALMENTAGGDLSELDYDDAYCGTGFLDVGEVFVEILFDNGAYDLWMDGNIVLSDTLGTYAPSTVDLALGFSAGTGGAWAEMLVDDVYVQCINSSASSSAVCDDFDCIDSDLGSATGAGVASGSSLGAGDDFSASAALGDCSAGTGSGGADVVFKWTAPSAGTYTIDTAGSDYDTVLYLLDGCSGSDLACDDDALGGSGPSEIARSFSAGEEVLIVLDAFSGVGNYVLNIN